MKKIITIFLILVILMFNSALAFQVDRESTQVINKVNTHGKVISSRLISDDNFKYSPKYIIKNQKSKASLFIKCTAMMSCKYEERYGKNDFNTNRKSRDLGNKDPMMFTLY